MKILLKEITDLPELMKWRTEVITNVFGKTPDESLVEANAAYYNRHIPQRSHYAVVAEADGVECGCGAFCFTEELPSPDNPTGKCAYLMNIYVRQEFRNKGIAHFIISHLIEEARHRDCDKIYLETTDEGHPVYTSLGFHDMEGMMKLYEKD